MNKTRDSNIKKEVNFPVKICVRTNRALGKRDNKESYLQYPMPTIGVSISVICQQLNTMEGS